MGMPILHRSQPPPWLGVINWDIPPLTAVIARTHQVFTGRVSLFHLNWRVLTMDQWILHTVIEGSHIPLTSKSNQEATPYNPHFSPENQTLLQEEIHTLLEKQAIQLFPAHANKGLLLQHIYGTKKRWWSETSYQP